MKTQKTQYLITVLAIAILTALTAGCSKSSPPQQASDASSASAPTKDLGVVELSDATQSRVDLGAGRECIITPRVVSDNAMQIEIAVEVKDAAGNPKRLGSSRVTALAGQPFSISVGDTTIAMTPKIKAK